MSARLVMFSTTWCGYCVRLKRVLQTEGIEFDEVNIEHDDEAAEFVMSVNDGCRTVPTVRFPDGSVRTNPTPGQVRERLAATA